MLHRGAVGRFGICGHDARGAESMVRRTFPFYHPDPYHAESTMSILTRGGFKRLPAGGTTYAAVCFDRPLDFRKGLRRLPDPPG